VAGRNPATGAQELYQVGRQTRSGFPVARERAALADIMTKLGDNPDNISLFFVAYN
jgi:hypothetical protein